MAPATPEEQIRDASMLTTGSFEDVRTVNVNGTALAYRERSPAYLPRLTDRLQQLLPDAQRVEIAAASHVMSEENAAAVNDAILEFLSRTAARSGQSVS